MTIENSTEGIVQGIGFYNEWISGLPVECWNSNSMRTKGYIKERLELTPMVPSMLDKGGVNSRPDSYRVPDGVRTDGPGFSLCAAPLELSGPGFQDGRVNRMNEQRSGGSRTGDVRGGYSEGRS